MVIKIHVTSDICPYLSFQPCQWLTHRTIFQVNLPPDVRARVQICQMNWTQPLKDNLALGPRLLRWHAIARHLALYSWDFLCRKFVVKCHIFSLEGEFFVTKPISTKIEGCDDVQSFFAIWFRPAEETWDLYGSAAKSSTGERGKVRLDWSWHSYLQPFGSCQELLWKEPSPQLKCRSFCQHSLIIITILYHLVAKWKQWLLSWSTHHP